MTITITIAMQVDARLSPNSSAHHMSRYRAKDDAKQTTYYACYNANLEMFAPSLPLTFDYEIGHGKGRKKLDDDNAIGAMKAIRDAIAAYLGIDDRHVRTGTMTQTRDKTGAGYVRVTIREAHETEKGIAA